MVFWFFGLGGETAILTSQQLAAFARDGALVVPSVIDAGSLRAVREAFSGRVEELIARCHKLRMMDAVADDAGFDEKITALLCAAPECYQHLDISLPMLSDMAAQVPEWERLLGEKWRQQAGFFGDDAVFNLITHKNVLVIARQLLGEAVAVSPVQHVRIKPPQQLLPPAAVGDANMARTLWHQDEAVVTEDAKGAPILTVWLAVSDATIENGCMYAVRGSHEQEFSPPDFGLMRHCPGRELAGEIYIPDSAINKNDLMPLPAKAGDAVLLHKRTVHGAGANTSGGVRWSFDLRYQPLATASGRACFPSFAVSGEAAIDSGEEYRRRWLQARDDIISGKVAAVFNRRWDKYADLCA